MDPEGCRIDQLVRHAANGDAQAQADLVEEIRNYLRDLVTEHRAERRSTSDFCRRLVTRVQSDYGAYWAHDLEFARWMDGILQREAAAVCEL